MVLGNNRERSIGSIRICGFSIKNEMRDEGDGVASLLGEAIGLNWCDVSV